MIALFVAVMLATVGFASQTLGQDDGDRGDLRFVVVTHGQAADPYWSVVQNGVNQAAEDMGVQVEYQAPDTFDMVAMAQLIDAAVASQPDGMAISIPDADALGDRSKAVSTPASRWSRSTQAAMSPPKWECSPTSVRPSTRRVSAPGSAWARPA